MMKMEGGQDYLQMLCFWPDIPPSWETQLAAINMAPP